MVRLVGGDQEDPSIFLIFKYINKQNTMISNMVSEVVNDFFIGFKILFEVGVGSSPFSKLHYVSVFFNLW